MVHMPETEINRFGRNRNGDQKRNRNQIRRETYLPPVLIVPLVAYVVVMMPSSPAGPPLILGNNIRSVEN